MSWLPRENKLSPEQKSVIRKITETLENSFVEGFPGTGKSVILTYAALQSQGDRAILTYTNSLVGCIRNAVLERDSSISVETIDKFIDNSNTPPNVLFIDEAQDLNYTTFRGKKNIVGELKQKGCRIVLAADEGQSLYDKTVPLVDLFSELGIPPANRYKLVINYRMTKRMLNILNTLFPDRRVEIETGSLVTNVDVQYIDANDRNQEFDWILNKGRDLAIPNNPIAVIFSDNAAIDTFVEHFFSKAPKIRAKEKGSYKEECERLASLNELFRNKKSIFRFLGKSQGSMEESKNLGLVYLMTRNSSKGLDFETVFIPNCEDAAKPLESPNHAYVALSRAKRNLFLLGTGPSSEIKEKLEEKKLIVCINPSVVDDTIDLPF